mmetsp:Transcript_44047/g.103028  ORF Transcript_44047/g.103028 Transcript_44047/m.103028 type:complete len:230 (+) Transcript_44047:1839-2528(+)
MRGTWGQHSHELLERQEGLAQLELKRRVRLDGFGQITRKRGIVVRVEPFPRSTAFIVVTQHPAHALHELERHVCACGGVLELGKLGRIVPFLPPGLPELHEIRLLGKDRLLLHQITELAFEFCCRRLPLALDERDRAVWLLACCLVLNTALVAVVVCHCSLVRVEPGGQLLRRRVAWKERERFDCLENLKNSRISPKHLLCLVVEVCATRHRFEVRRCCRDPCQRRDAM